MEKEGFSEDERKDAEDVVQELTTKYNNKVDALLDIKDKEIMTV